MKASEASEQIKVIRWCKWHERFYPQLRLIHHIPNGGSRNALEAKNLKAQGVKAGVPDLCLPVARNGKHGLYIEMKYGKNVCTAMQKEWLRDLEEQDYETAVCHGADEAITVIEKYLSEMKKENN